MDDLRPAELMDDHFAWLLGVRPAPDGLTEAPGGVGDRAVISMLRDLTAALYRAACRGRWLIVDGGEVVGLCGFKRPPDPSGRVEIGYGIAESRRNRGYAIRAVALMLARGRREDASTLTAETVASNPASQRMLERNGFGCTGTRRDPEDGELMLWARPMPV